MGGMCGGVGSVRSEGAVAWSARTASRMQEGWIKGWREVGLVWYSLGKVVILRAEISYTPLSASGALCAVCCLTFGTWNNYIELGSKRRCVGYRQQNVQILAEILC